jgi:uncharacterized membrane protein
MALVPPIARPGSVDEAIRRGLVATLCHVCRHWLAYSNAGLVIFAVLPVLSPVLAALGANDAALLIFQVYSITCHQMPSRSFFLFGHQMAYCERNTSIYGTMAIASLGYAVFRGRGVAPLSIPLYLILILPMAVDGFTQLFLLRESTWLLRALTGALFGVATAWFALPRLNQSFAEIEAELAQLSIEN